TLQTQLNVREATGKNDGIEVARYLRSTGLGIGNPWCAAFCAYNLKALQVPNPMSAYSPNFAKKKDIIWTPKLEAQGIAKQPQTGDCFTLFYPNLNRVGHVGFVINRSGGYFITIEGNTNSEGGREGNGVFKRKRDVRKIHAITNYITPYIKSITHETNNNITAVNYIYSNSLQSQNDSIDRERCNFCDRLDSLRNKNNSNRYLLYQKSGQRIDKGYTNSQRWSNKHARNNCREYRSKSNCECGKQPINCELFVQGIRNKIPSSNAHGEFLAQTIFTERKSKNNHENRVCEVYTSLG
ncbi:MAG: CHAP domain-containing protein, partial [Bacteroidia bacterium]|nr:CHAP domain-containing protein [Bacteroidia bacterium]